MINVPATDRTCAYENSLSFLLLVDLASIEWCHTKAQKPILSYILKGQSFGTGCHRRQSFENLLRLAGLKSLGKKEPCITYSTNVTRRTLVHGLLIPIGSPVYVPMPQNGSQHKTYHFLTKQLVTFKVFKTANQHHSGAMTQNQNIHGSRDPGKVFLEIERVV